MDFCRERMGLEELERNEEMKEKMNSCKKKKRLVTVEKMKKQEDTQWLNYV